MKVNLTLACFSYVTNKFKLGWVEFCWWSSSSSDTPVSRHSYFGSHVFLGLNREISFARNTQNLVPASLSHYLLPLYTVPLGSYHTELPSLRICYLGQIEWSRGTDPTGYAYCITYLLEWPIWWQAEGWRCWQPCSHSVCKAGAEGSKLYWEFLLCSPYWEAEKSGVLG